MFIIGLPGWVGAYGPDAGPPPIIIDTDDDVFVSVRTNEVFISRRSNLAVVSNRSNPVYESERDNPVYVSTRRNDPVQ